jgi:DNA-binding transcriptional MerR regulator
VGDRAHLSIGEVLSLLREEFPDVTISKIRFLESQGLLDPERTPSGYRKFYDDDVERLRWILRQQREHFLPLKVIKGRLSDTGSETDVDELEPSTGPAEPDAAPGPEEREEDGSARSEGTGTASLPPSAGAAAAGTAAGSAGPAGSAPGGQDRRSPPGSSTLAVPGAGHAADGPSAAAMTAPETGPATAPSAPRAGAAAAEPAGAVNMTLEELAAATGLGDEQVRDLARYGLLIGRDLGGTVYFDDDALAVAQLAAGFARHGVEARHLRMYKNAADRETGVFEQVVMPLFKQRNPRARQQAMRSLEELSQLGADLRDALLRAALRDAF